MRFSALLNHDISIDHIIIVFVWFLNIILFIFMGKKRGSLKLLLDIMIIDSWSKYVWALNVINFTFNVILGMLIIIWYIICEEFLFILCTFLGDILVYYWTQSLIVINILILFHSCKILIVLCHRVLWKLNIIIFNALSLNGVHEMHAIADDAALIILMVGL